MRGVELVLLHGLDADLALRLGHGLDHGHVLEEVDLAGVVVEPGLELAGGTEDALRGLEDGRLDRLHEDLLLDPLLFRDLLEDAAEAAVGARHRCHRCHDSFSLLIRLRRPGGARRGLALRVLPFGAALGLALALGSAISSKTRLASATSANGTSMRLPSTTTATAPLGRLREGAAEQALAVGRRAAPA